MKPILLFISLLNLEITSDGWVVQDTWRHSYRASAKGGVGDVLDDVGCTGRKKFIVNPCRAKAGAANVLRAFVDESTSGRRGSDSTRFD